MHELVGAGPACLVSADGSSIGSQSLPGAPERAINEDAFWAACDGLIEQGVLALEEEKN